MKERKKEGKNRKDKKEELEGRSEKGIEEWK
jgi:hypothetical protein